MANQDINVLNSLRNLVNPQEDVDFKLTLNKHPKGYKNKSMSYALNMRLSEDATTLLNDNSLIENTFITNPLEAVYNNDYKIIYILPCNKELVLFIKRPNENLFDIWRYREDDIEMALFYNKGIIYNGGKFSGTFTYTSNDSLIIAFCEYDSYNGIEIDDTILNPMMTINLGTFTEGYIYKNYIWHEKVSTFNDRQLDTYKLPLCPEVELPTINKSTIVKGQSYTGIYYFYIRYKINNYDYTQWFNFGYPIEHINRSKQCIAKTVLKNKEGYDGIEENDDHAVPLAETTSVLYDLNIYAANKVDLLTSCISIDVRHINKLYDKFQVGCICVAANYTKYYTSSDIQLNNENTIVFDINNLIEEQFNTDIYHNFYNVKTIINKKNKLYIANYKEREHKEINTENIKLDLTKIGEINNDPSNTEYYTQIGDRKFITSKFTKNFVLSKYFENTNLGGQTPRLLMPLTDISEVYYTQDNYKIVSLAYYLYSIGKLYALEKTGIIENDTITLRYNNYNDRPYHNSDGIYYVTPTLIEKSYNIYTDFIYVTENIHLPYSDDKFIYNEPDGRGKRYMNGYNDRCFNLFSLEALNNGDDFTKQPNIYGLFDARTDKNYGYYIGDKSYRNNILQMTSKIEIKLPDGTYEDITGDMVSTNSLSPESYKPVINPLQDLNREINENILTGLVQGEIYDFYINFIDKYGEITPGFRLENKDDYIKKDFLNYPNQDAVCFRLIDDNDNPHDYFIMANANILVKYPDGSKHINISNESVISRDTTHIIDDNELDNLRDCFTGLLELNENILEKLTFGDLIDDSFYCDKFLPFVNTEGHKLFRVPIDKSQDPTFNPENPIKTDNYYGVTINGLPTNLFGYKSYFISYKKLEKRYKIDGFGNEYQMNNIHLNMHEALNGKNENIGDIVITSNISKNSYNIESSEENLPQPEASLQNYDLNFSYNNYHTNGYSTLAYAEDNQLDREGRTTTVYFTQNRNNIDPFNSYNNHLLICYVKTLTINKACYINDNKELYRLGNILTEGNVISDGLNGIYKAHTAFMYGTESHFVNVLTTLSGQRAFGDMFLYHMYGFYDDDINGEFLSTVPKVVKIADTTKTPVINKGSNIYYSPFDTLNMFNYKLLNRHTSAIQFTLPYIKNNYLYEFNRTIYRSNVISDESKENNWRFFEAEAYKNVEENKGNITNLISIGNYLYIHTEHSLFALNDNNSLSMNNQELQVSSPDIFDVEYKEQFITQLGYGGLQDKDSWIVDQYGYTYYNGDRKEFIALYGDKLNIISEDIYEFIKYFNPTKVLFGKDEQNNRIFIQLTHNNQVIVLSYNTKYKRFISIHDILTNGFDKAYNTKELLYLLKGNKIYQFNEQYGKDVNNNKEYKVSFIINTHYNRIKYLEYLFYKLRKKPYIEECNINVQEFPIYVDSNLIPFSGETIRIFNDLIDTENINVITNIDPISNKPDNSVAVFDKPYWNLGNWNFNYFRDKHNTTNPESRLYGNYFIIEFNFGSVKELIEFENLQVNLSEDKTI